MKKKIRELEVFFISYDEPNADDHWVNLLMKFPSAKRIHGIKGFDAAHKACALKSSTDYLITIDGDNIVLPEFFEEEVELYDNAVYSWSSINHINGLIYGNGSIKLWPKNLILNMKTHENAIDVKNKIDFCWGVNYIQQNKIYSINYPNGSPFQAFRAGFREGVKMSLNQGELVDIKKFKESLYFKNYHRLLIWLTIGRDINHGFWAIFGARMGLYKTYLTDWDFTKTNDYEWFENFWNTEIGKKIKYSGMNKYFSNTLIYSPAIEKEIKELGVILKNKLNIPISELDATASEFFKTVYKNPKRVDN